MNYKCSIHDKCKFVKKLYKFEKKHLQSTINCVNIILVRNKLQNKQKGGKNMKSKLVYEVL